MKFTFTSILMTFCFLAASAIPAKQGSRTITQPDGSTLIINTIGDEFFHLSTTEDGYLLATDKDGFYRLGMIDPSGLIVSTGLVPTSETKLYKGVKLSDINLESLKLNGERMKSAPQFGMGKYANSYPRKGSPRCIVILAEFSDVKFNTDYDVKEYFNEMMNGENFDMYGGTGSVAQYFREQSGGKFTPVFDVYGPVTLPNTQAYYGDNRGQTWDCFAHYMVSHAAEILNPTVDFSLYDENGDGDVDFVYVFYAGQGEHNQGGPNTVWPHSGWLKKVADFKLVDGKYLNLYACSNEMEGDQLAGMGPFIHEYSHVLGLPDLYTTLPPADGVVDFTPGRYSVLDYGVYNNDSRTPPNYTAYERNALEWNEPIVMNKSMTAALQEISTGNFGLIPTNVNNEFFLVENRQPVGWDKYLPGHGILIWHIDYNKARFEDNEVNTAKAHQLVDLVKANNENSFLRFQEGYPFAGISGNTAFTFHTTPAMKTWAGADIKMPITDMAIVDGVAYFDLAGGIALSAPSPTVVDYSLEDRYFIAEWEPVESAADYIITIYGGLADQGDNNILTENILTEGKTRYKVENLPIGTNNFHFTVIAQRVTNCSDPCAPVDIMLELPTSVIDIDSNDIQPEYFNLQGLPVSNPSKGMLLIRREGQKVDKIIY